jgi:hypothetical protein
VTFEALGGAETECRENVGAGNSNEFKARCGLLFVVK